MVVVVTGAMVMYLEALGHGVEGLGFRICSGPARAQLFKASLA